MSKTSLHILILILTLLLQKSIFAESEHKIAILVNEEMITTYEIVQRMKINAILQGINLNSENSQVLANSVAEELIQEKLKEEKINEYDILISDEDYNDHELNFFQNLRFDKNAILNSLEENNINYQEFKVFLRTQMAWQKLIGALYFRLTSVSETEISDIMAKNPNLNKEQAENLVIQRQLDLKSSKLLRDMLNEATIEYK